MSRRPRILVVGSSNTDMVVKADRIPSPGETVLGGAFFMTPGGKGANQAIAAARLGADVAILARVGDDIFGREAEAGLAASGVDTRYIVRDDSAPSGIALISVDAAGQNAIMVAPGANARLSPEDIERAREAFQWADAVLLQLEIPLSAVSAAVGLARALGKMAVLNPAPVPPEAPPQLLQSLDMVTPNETEAAMLAGWPCDSLPEAERAAQELLRRGAAAAVITLGAAGAIAASGRGIEAIPAWSVESIDATAAGDCFSAALVVGLLQEMSLPEACRFASAAAAISVTRLGAQASMPHRAEVDALLAGGSAQEP